MKPIFAICAMAMLGACGAGTAQYSTDARLGSTAQTAPQGIVSGGYPAPGLNAASYQRCQAAGLNCGDYYLR